MQKRLGEEAMGEGERGRGERGRRESGRGGAGERMGRGQGGRGRQREAERDGEGSRTLHEAGLRTEGCAAHMPQELIGNLVFSTYRELWNLYYSVLGRPSARLRTCPSKLPRAREGGPAGHP